MRSSTKLLRSKTLVAIAVAAVSVGATSAARADETVRAVWNVQEIYLPYFGLTTHYSCDGLYDKMREILKDLSVRSDFVVNISGCTELTGPVRSPTVHMVIANAVPATDDVAKAFAADPKRAKLLARLQRKSKTPISDQAFDAVVKQVVLHAKDRINAGVAGDCELMEQVRRDVLPKLGAKVLKDNMHCTPHQGIAGNPQIELELLVAAPKA
jgi:hypothetical protein